MEDIIIWNKPWQFLFAFHLEHSLKTSLAEYTEVVFLNCSGILRIFLVIETESNGQGH